MSCSEHVLSDGSNIPWLERPNTSAALNVGARDGYENSKQAGCADSQVDAMRLAVSPTKDDKGDANQDLLLSYDYEVAPNDASQAREQFDRERKESGIHGRMNPPSSAAVPNAQIVARAMLLPCDNDNDGQRQHATRRGGASGAQEELFVNPLIGSQPRLQLHPPMEEFMSPSGDASSEEIKSTNDSDKAVCNGPQHDEALIDLACNLDHVLQESNLNDSFVFERVQDRLKSHNDASAGGGVPRYKSEEHESHVPSLAPISNYVADHQQSATPTMRRLSSHQRPASPRLPASQGDRSETYLHTFETDRFETRLPAPPFVVVPHGTESARVTVTTLGIQYSEDDENSLTNQIYLRRGFVAILIAILSLGVITMISGFYRPARFGETQPPLPFEPIVGAPAPASLPGTPQPTTIFDVFEPAPTPHVISFPVEGTRSPGVFLPIDGKIVREETPSPTLTASPTVSRIRPTEPEPTLPEATATVGPTFVPSVEPSAGPSREPSVTPSTRPSAEPSARPSWGPTREPSIKPLHHTPPKKKKKTPIHPPA